MARFRKKYDMMSLRSVFFMIMTLERKTFPKRNKKK